VRDFSSVQTLLYFPNYLSATASPIPFRPNDLISAHTFLQNRICSGSRIRLTRWTPLSANRNTGATWWARAALETKIQDRADVTSNIDPNRDLNHRVPVHRACFVILSRSKSKSGEHRFCLLTGCARRTTVLKNDNSR
jgi:hypothetical protein